MGSLLGTLEFEVDGSVDWTNKAGCRLGRKTAHVRVFLIN